MSSLNLLRKNTLNITNLIISNILDRKTDVLEIQKLKGFSSKELIHKTTRFKNFDFVRELFVFQSLDRLNQLSVKEVLSLSLLIESQAGNSDDYPCWSSGVHLAQKPNSILQQINPILLASTFKTSYDALPLNEEFKELFKDLIT